MEKQRSLLRCKHCSREFGKLEHLTRHERSHTGEKPFQCPVCRRKYARSDVLARHIQIHDSNVAQKPQVPAMDTNLGPARVATEPQHFGILGDNGIPEQVGGWEPHTFPDLTFDLETGNTSHIVSLSSEEPVLVGNNILEPMAIDPTLQDILPSPYETDGINYLTNSFTCTSESRCTLLQNVRNLWPKREPRVSRPRPSIWEEVAWSQRRCLFDMPSEEAAAALIRNPAEGNSAISYGFDESCRARVLSALVVSQSGTSKLEILSTEKLAMSLNLYFRRFHHLMPFVHEATFVAPRVDTILLVPLCLIGLGHLKDSAATNLIHSVLMTCTENCIRRLQDPVVRKHIDHLLTTVGAAILFMCLAVMTPDLDYLAQVEQLYVETVTTAQRYGLTVFDHDVSSSLGDNDHGENEESWLAWAKLESAKRTIISLVMADALFSHELNTVPILHSENLRLSLPSSLSAFKAPNAQAWAAVPHHDRYSQSTASLWNTEHIPTASDELGIFGILSFLWTRVTAMRSVPVLDSRQRSLNESIATSLLDFYSSNFGQLMSTNQNCLVSFNSVCMDLGTDKYMLHRAAGRYHSELDESVLFELIAWSSTPAARQSCLHAAQNYLILSRSKVSDGIMFHSETALLTSALVLGLYLIARGATSETLSDSNSPTKPNFELLQDVDWTEIGLPGLFDSMVSFESESLSPPTAFIKYGGGISFSGEILEPGYVSARRIFMDFAALIETVGKWNFRANCQILHELSDVNFVLPTICPAD